jgi:hypothetical protein
VEGLVIGLVALACPVAMGVMMWLMAKGGRKGGNAIEEHASLDELRAEHRRLGAEIDRLEDDSSRSSMLRSSR